MVPRRTPKRRRSAVLLVGPRALEDDVERLAVVHVEAEARAVAHVALTPCALPADLHAIDVTRRASPRR